MNISYFIYKVLATTNICEDNILLAFYDKDDVIKCFDQYYEYLDKYAKRNTMIKAYLGIEKETDINDSKKEDKTDINDSKKDDETIKASQDSIKPLKVNIYPIPDDKRERIAVIDLGGSQVKFGLVDMKFKDSKIVYEVLHSTKLEFPKGTETIIWYEWLGEKFAAYLNGLEVLPTKCSLIFSYPLEYTPSGDAYPLKFTKFWCFEREKSLTEEIKSKLNASIQLHTKDCPKYKDIRIDYVLNDVIATHYASFLFTEGDSMAIVMGTGTNLSVRLLDKSDAIYFQNMEWAAFQPMNIKLLKEEALVIKELPSTFNYLDVLCGMGYKWLILNKLKTERNIDMETLKMEDLEGKIPYLDKDHITFKLFYLLINRSLQLMSAMICAVIRKYEFENVKIILEGGIFRNQVIRKHLIDNINVVMEMIQHNKVSETQLIFHEHMSLLGSAYHAFSSAEGN